MKKYAILVFFIGTLVMMFVMAKTGDSLKTVSTPHGILDLEFAYDSSKTNAVIKAWDWQPGKSIDKNSMARINTWLDFIFLFFYSVFLFLTAKKIAVVFNGPVEKAGNIIAKGALLAGFFDVLENTGMLLTLTGHTSSGIAFFTTFFSVIKWVLAVIAVLYVITGLLVLAYRKVKT